MYSGGSIAVHCTRCHAILAAPRGHAVIACGNCRAELRIAMVPREAASPQALRAEMAAAAERARHEARAANAASESGLAACTVFRADDALAAQGLECPISTDPIVVGSAVMKLPCGHMFLEDSIRMWLATSNTCPICRAELASRSGGARVDEERAAYEAARRVRESHGTGGSSMSGSGGMVGGPFDPRGLRVTGLPRGGGYPPSGTARGNAGYPMSGGSSGGWRPAPTYREQRRDGEGCAVM